MMDTSGGNAVRAEDSETRRGFLVGTGRWVLAFILSGGTGLLALRQGRGCLVRQGCLDCGVLDRCSLPQAAKQRQTLADRR